MIKKLIVKHKVINRLHKLKHKKFFVNKLGGIKKPFLKEGKAVKLIKTTVVELNLCLLYGLRDNLS